MNEVLQKTANRFFPKTFAANYLGYFTQQLFNEQPFSRIHDGWFCKYHSLFL